jgi:hypothetical protein
MTCPHCSAELPRDAQYCIECGAAAGEAHTGETVKLGEPQEARSCAVCGRVNPLEARYCMGCGNPLDESAAPAATGFDMTALLPWALLLGGLFLAMALFRVWPNFLIFIGIGGFAGGMLRGRWWFGLMLLIWSFGLGLLLTVPRLLYPGILVLIIVSALLWFVRQQQHNP